MFENVSALPAKREPIVASFEDDDGAALTRQSIVRAASDRVDLSQREIKRLVDGVIEEMTAALVRGETVKLHDFGSFVVRDKGLRSGRNPRTGQRVPIEPRKVVVFKASPKLKEAMNKPRAGERRTRPRAMKS